MSGLEINVVVNEIKQQLLGLRVINVYSINKRTYLIKLSGTNAHFPTTTKQYLLIESGVRLHLTNFEREIDSTPNGLATTIRRQLKGKTLANIEQGGLDRVVRLEFGIGQTAFNIFVELFGTGNIVFTDYEHNILALLKQQAYGSSLLGSQNASEPSFPAAPATAASSTDPSTATAATVTLRSKYQWNEQGQNQSFPPAQLNLDFVLTLFQNKHQRLLEQLQQEQQQLEDEPHTSQTQSNSGRKEKNTRKKDRSQQITVKQVLYESILGPQLCLHGCTQYPDLDINQLYTTVLTDVDYLNKLVIALQTGLNYYYTIIRDCCGYLYSRLTTTIVENFDEKGQLINSKTDDMLITGDFSPGNLAQTTISPVIYISPQSGSNNNNNNNNATNDTKDVNGDNIIAADVVKDDAKLDILMTVSGCNNKVNATDAISVDKNGNKTIMKLYETFELPQNGYQTFNWGLITPTSAKTTTVNTIVDKNEKKKKKWQKKENDEPNDTVANNDDNTPQPTTRTTVIIKDVWFYTARFSACVDIYYGTKEVEKEVQRIEREKTNVLTRIEKTKLEQMSKLQTLQDNIDTMLLKAKLIENNEFFIQQAINAVRQQLDRGRDWFLIADIIKQQQGLFNPIALLIEKLEFNSNSFIASLSWDLEHIQIKIQKEIVKRNQEEAKLHREHIIEPTGGDDSDDSDDNDQNNNKTNDNTAEDDDNDEEQDVTYVDDVTEESLQIARDDKADEIARLNAPGSWKKPIKITINYTQTAFANAKSYYTMVKELVRKKHVAEQFSEQTIKSIEKKGQRELHQVKEIQAKQRRKVMWFEKFFWCVSSENFLIVGGRDATQNEILVKRYLDTNDIYFHADIHGASSVVVKVPTAYLQAYQAQFGVDKPLQLPQVTLFEAAAFTSCHSNAWVNKTNNVRAYWVYSHQVSKTPPTGMYLEKGSFMIRGNKNYIEPQPLQMGVALLFKCGDDETIFNHQNERQVRSLGSFQTETGMDTAPTNDANTIFQLEQNKKQQLQELQIQRLEEAEREKKHQKLQLERLKQQKSRSLTSPSASMTTPTDDANPNLGDQKTPQAKRILSKNDRYQMKKLGLTDPAVYWAHKDANNKKKDNSDDTNDVIVPNQQDDEVEADDDDVDEVDFENVSDDGDIINDDEIGEDEDDDGNVPSWLLDAREKFGFSDDDDDDDDDHDGEDDDDEDDDNDQDEIGEDVDDDGVSPAWLKRAKDVNGDSDNEDEDDEPDQNDKVPEMLDQSPVPKSTTKPIELLEKNKIYQANQPKTKRGQKTANKPEPTPTAPKPAQQHNQQRGGKNKAAKRSANKGFESDEEDIDFDPMKFLSKSKQKSLLKSSILASSSDDDQNKKQPQHGVNRKKGNTKQARLERQEQAKKAAEETKLLKQKQIEERERLHKEKLALKKLAKQQSAQPQDHVDNREDNIDVADNDDNDGDDDDDDDDMAFQKLQQQRLEMEGTSYLLSTLTSKPQLGDYITHAVPVVAPYASLLDYPFKVKLVPGGGKKGQTIKDSTHVLLQTVSSLYKHPPQTASQIRSTKTTNNSASVVIPIDQLSVEEQQEIQREKNFQNLLNSLVKQISDSEFSLTMMSNAKVSVQGIQQVHKQQKIQRKNNAKQKEKQKK